MSTPDGKTPIIPGEVLIFKEDLMPVEARIPKFTVGKQGEYVVAASIGSLAAIGVEKYTVIPYVAGLFVTCFGVLAVEEAVLGRLSRNGYIERVQ